MSNAAPIRFPCPNCNFALSAPEEKAGAKGRCPKCGQRCIVPLPFRGSDPVLLTQFTATGDAPASDGPVPQPVSDPVVYDDPPPRRKWLLPVVIGGVVLMLGCAGVSMLGLTLLPRRSTDLQGGSPKETSRAAWEKGEKMTITGRLKIVTVDGTQMFEEGGKHDIIIILKWKGREVFCRFPKADPRMDKLDDVKWVTVVGLFDGADDNFIFMTECTLFP